MQGNERVAKAQTPLSGEYRLVVWRPNHTPYLLEAAKDDLSRRVPGLDFSAGGARSMDLTLYPAPSVTGTVLLGDQPRGGCQSGLEPVGAEGQKQAALSNAKGEFRFRQVAPGQYRVKAAAAGGPVYAQEGKVLSIAERTTPEGLVIRLPDPGVGSGPSALGGTRNQVLQFEGGTLSYVELPAHIFDGLEEATVEGWVRWDRFATDARFFDFGDQGRTMCLGESGQTADLRLEVWDSRRRSQVDLVIPKVLRNRQVVSSGDRDRPSWRAGLFQWGVGGHG